MELKYHSGHRQGKPSKPTVIYIAGWGRSGTTLLDQVLGQLPGAWSCGELHNLWRHSQDPNRLCGCGDALADCSFWNQVLSDYDADKYRQILARQRKITTKRTPFLALRRRGRIDYRQDLERLYSKIEDATNADFIIDSSKFPADALVATDIQSVNLYVIHMVRDPRGVAFSWQRKLKSPGKTTDGGELDRVSILRSTAVWVLYNSVLSSIIRWFCGDNYMRVSYERFASEPYDVVKDIAVHCGLPVEQIPVSLKDAKICKGVTHTASGNPRRFTTGETDITLDDEWRTELSVRKKLWVSLLAGPLARYYGYRVL